MIVCGSYLLGNPGHQGGGKMHYLFSQKGWEQPHFGGLKATPCDTQELLLALHRHHSLWAWRPYVRMLGIKFGSVTCKASASPIFPLKWLNFPCMGSWEWTCGSCTPRPLQSYHLVTEMSLLLQKHTEYRSTEPTWRTRLPGAGSMTSWVLSGSQNKTKETTTLLR